mgnify:CR=1 FL=1
MEAAMEVTDEGAVARDVLDEVGVVMEVVADVTVTALAVDDDHGSVRPLIQDLGTGADG